MININEKIDDHVETIQAIRPLVPQMEALGRRMSECLSNDGKILWMGNGGSAADSQHLAAELVGRFSRKRAGLASIALSTDTSSLSSCGIYYVFEKIFARQIDALCRPGDVVVGISTSGNSVNVLEAIQLAKTREALTIGFARRFATYKRADLILRDEEKLQQLLLDSDRPVQLVFAGKAHPADRPGQDMIRRIYQASRRPELKGRIVSQDRGSSRKRKGE